VFDAFRGTRHKRIGVPSSEIRCVQGISEV
jgi:hypothetical protein